MDDVSINLMLFERQISGQNIAKENWIMYLLSSASLKIVNIIARNSIWKQIIKITNKTYF